MVSDSTALSAGRLGGRASAAAGQRSGDVDLRRWFQLGLAAIWLLDAILQYQSFMFTRGFSQMLAGTAAGNPAFIAEPITWAARIIAQHPVPANVGFATIQLLIGFGIAWRPTLRAALAASVVWSVAVWWFGEGLGGVLTGGASPVSGAPGAVILYALLAVLLWPVSEPAKSPAPFVAARPSGRLTASLLWLVLWGSLAYLAVTAANRTAQGLHDMVAGMADGEPSWLAATDRGAAGLLAHQGLSASIVLAVVLALIAVGVFLPVPLHKAAIVLALVLSAAIWVVGQNLGGILAGGATDVNSGLLLALIALAYWPVAAVTRGTPDATEAPAS